MHSIIQTLGDKGYGGKILHTLGGKGYGGKAINA